MSRQAFFKQSGWMITATVASGAFMFAVHFFAKKIPESEYGLFGTLISVLNCLAIPAVGLQMVFVQQTAAAVDEPQLRRLRGTVRGVLLGTFLIWLTAVVAMALFHQSIVRRWEISNPLSLWLTLVVGLGAVWIPILGGLLQGQQNFLWFGWASILNGAGRFLAVALIVLLFQGYAAGMVVGILLGTTISLAIYAWHTRSLWWGPAEAFNWRPWLGKVIPLTVGFGAFQFMLTADPLFVQTWFDKDQTGYYIAAGTLARAVVMFTSPVVWVMFPKIVRSVALAEKTDVMWLTLGLTAVMAVLGALGLSVVAPWILKLVYKESYLAAVPLLRWFAWSMMPLTIANVLINNFMARSQFGVVPWLVGVAVVYALLLNLYHDSFLAVIQVIGVGNLLFLATTLCFAWRLSRRKPAPSDQPTLEAS